MADKGERFDVGRVAGRTFGVIGRNPLLFFGIALLFSGLPTLALGLLGYASPSQAMGTGWVLPIALGFLTYFVLANLLQTSLVVATLQDLGGQRVDFAACVRRALVLFLPLIGMSFVIAFGVALGFLLLVVPGIIVYLMWFVAVPALVEEREGVFAALSRSAALTSGARWSIFGLVIAYAIFSIVVALVAGLLIRLAPGLAFTAVVNAATTTLNSLIASAGVAAAYVELRTVKEGTNIDDLAAVFA